MMLNEHISYNRMAAVPVSQSPPSSCSDFYHYPALLAVRLPGRFIFPAAVASVQLFHPLSSTRPAPLPSRARLAPDSALPTTSTPRHYGMFESPRPMQTARKGHRQRSRCSGQWHGSRTKTCHTIYLNAVVLSTQRTQHNEAVDPIVNCRCNGHARSINHDSQTQRTEGSRQACYPTCQHTQETEAAAAASLPAGRTPPKAVAIGLPRPRLPLYPAKPPRSPRIKLRKWLLVT
jgi:hypothetical protein